MRLLKYDNYDNFTFTSNLVKRALIPPYAILSHTWGPEGDEISYHDILNLNGSVQKKPGFQKLRFCAKKAKSDGLDYFWIDTCCINKSDSSELTEAINSMYRWYAESRVCYVYLSDVRDIYGQYAPSQDLVRSPRGQEQGKLPLESQIRASRWFTRGWTLQELLAPKNIGFYSSSGVSLFDKDESSVETLGEITGIPHDALLGNVPLSRFGIEERFKWAASRKTTREEDIAYCMLGIFNVFIPLIYGEGEVNASYRLRRGIKEREDTSKQALKSFPQESAAQALKRGALSGMIGLVGGVGGSLATLSLMASTTPFGKMGYQTDTTAPSSTQSSKYSSETPLTTTDGHPDSEISTSTPKHGVPDSAKASAHLPSPGDWIDVKPRRCTVEVRLRSYRYNLSEENVLESLSKIFPNIPVKEFRLTQVDGSYQVWLPRDLTEAERATITKNRVPVLGYIPSAFAFPPTF